MLLLTAGPLFAQQAKPPELQFHPVPDFLKLPDDVCFGECVGVAVDSKESIYVANRGKHPLMEFRPDGTFMRFIDEGLNIHEAAHSVILDPQDNIWFIDAATNLIVRMDQQTRPQMVLGKNRRRGHGKHTSSSMARRAPRISISLRAWPSLLMEASLFRMDMATRGSRISARTEFSSRIGARAEMRSGGSIRRTRSLWMQKESCTWGTEETGGFRFSMPKVIS